MGVRVWESMSEIEGGEIMECSSKGCELKGCALKGCITLLTARTRDAQFIQRPCQFVPVQLHQTILLVIHALVVGVCVITPRLPPLVLILVLLFPLRPSFL